MIQQDIIDRVLDRADIVDVISGYVQLNKKGRDYVSCCPFHKEKTASFHVSPSRQTWHCFGACQDGGNVINFIMKYEGLTFPEAVKLLAKRYGIEIIEKMEDPDEKQVRLRLEAFQIINQKVAGFYANILKENKDAKDYVIGRWGEKYCKEAEIGYAPESYDTLVNWAEVNGENLDFLIELGLLRKKESTGHIYDAFRNRIIIPIRNRSRSIIGFTARDMTGENDVAKYINSPESILYHKGKTVFGIDEAAREGAKKEMFYLVEGAPDAMKMHAVDINNAVASLGGTWTKEQLLELKKITDNICFINDADPKPLESEYGPGIKYVIENGEKAIKLGMNVTVRELPIGKGNSKQDPGSFFSCANDLKKLEEEDFIAWETGKIYNKDDSLQKKTETILHLAELASWIEDSIKLDMVIEELNKIRRNKEFWKATINKAKWDRNKKEQQKNGEVDLRQYGFTEDHGGYVGVNDKGEYDWSNFTMKPLYHIRDEDSPKRLFSIKNRQGRTEIIELNMEELVSIPKFQQKLEGIGDFQWMAGARELIKLKSYLYSNTETANLIKKMGWNDNGFYAFGNGIWMDGKFYEADKYGICKLPEKGIWLIPAASKIHKNDFNKYERERKFVHNNLSTIKMADYLKKFTTVYGNNGKIGICYWMSSLFRDIITGYTRYFPILDLFGPKGSGKTELGTALMAFFCTDNKAPNLNNSTATALNDDVAFSCDALVHLDEYKNNIRPDKIEFLKGLYDGVGRVKMSGASFESRIMTSVKSGVIMSGQEMPTVDIALFHRCIFLSFPKSEFTISERKNFAELRDLQKFGLTGMTLEVLKNRKRMEALYMEKYNETIKDINRMTNERVLETRIIESWARILATLKVVEDYLDLPFSYNEMLPIFVAGIKNQNKLSGTGNELAGFWNTVSYLRDAGEIFEASDYKIESKVYIKTDITERRFKNAHKILLLNKNRVFMLYKRSNTLVGTTGLPEDTLKQYLMNADYYIGIVKSVRFKTIIKGIAEKVLTTSGVRDAERVLQAYAFDYDLMMEEYGINLENENPFNHKEEEVTEVRNLAPETDNKLPF